MITNETIDKMNIMKAAKKLAKRDVEVVGLIDILLVISFVACVVVEVLQLQF